MSNQNKAKTAKAGKTTARDIKVWLQGILEFQPEGWVPSEVQWKTIKDKIMSLQDEEVVYQKVKVDPAGRVTESSVQPQPVQPARVVHDAPPSGPSSLRVQPHTADDGYKTQFG